MKLFLIACTLACASAGQVNIEKVDNSFNMPEAATGRAEVDDDGSLNKIRNDLDSFDPAGFTTAGNILGDEDGDIIEAGIVVSDKEYHAEYQQADQLGAHSADLRMSQRNEQASASGPVGATTTELFAAAAVACVAAAVIAVVLRKKKTALIADESLPVVASL